jgi:hypothetical protein
LWWALVEQLHCQLLNCASFKRGRLHCINIRIFHPPEPSMMAILIPVTMAFGIPSSFVKVEKTVEISPVINDQRGAVN